MTRLREEVKDLIVDSWSECEKYIKGVKGQSIKVLLQLLKLKNICQGDPILKGRDSYPLI